MSETLIKAFGDQGNFPGIMLGVSMGLLTIMIPLAIAIFGRPQRYEVLDKNVFWDYIFNKKRMVAIIMFTFIPPVIWNFSLQLHSNTMATLAPLFLSGLWITGNILILYNMKRLYKWAKGNEYGLRFKYLKKIKGSRALLDSWNSVWQTKEIELSNEIEFFKIFAGSLDKMSKRKRKQLVSLCELLANFSQFMDNRSLKLLWRGDVYLRPVLRWHEKYWQLLEKSREKPIVQNANGEEFSLYFIIENSLIQIIIETERRLLIRPYAYGLFSEIARRAKEISESDNQKRDSYLDEFLSIIFNTLFESLPSIEKADDILEHYFPNSWKITKDNLSGANKFFAKFTLDYVRRWAFYRIHYPKDGSDDEVLDRVIRYLFPEVDPITWAAILIFILISNGRAESLNLVIERKWNFGKFSRLLLKDFLIENEEDMMRKGQCQLNEQEKKSYELALLIFKGCFSSDALQSYIKELELLKDKYGPNSIEAEKRSRLERIFSEMYKLQSAGHSDSTS